MRTQSKLTPSLQGNMLTEAWLDVLDLHARIQRISPLDAIKQAPELHRVVASSPLDEFAALRFLITLLYWKADECGGVEHLREKLLAGTVPQQLVEAVEAEADRFNLFDEEQPYLQDPVLRKEKKGKSVGELMAEYSVGTNVAHFHHGDDHNMEMCAECVARGLARVVPWSQSGGAGLTPSIHGAPPLMLIPIGETLQKTLGLNLIPLNRVSGTPQLSGTFTPAVTSGDIPVMQALTWNPRRIALPETQTIERCWSCGATNVQGIGPLVFNKNPHTAKKGDKGPFQWRDPAAFYGTDDSTQYTTLKSSKEFLAADGRDLRRLGEDERNVRAEVSELQSKHDSWSIVVPCTNPANNKTFDHRRLELNSLSPEAITPLLPKRNERCDANPHRPSMYGWNKRLGWQESGLWNATYRFFTNANVTLGVADWARLENAALKLMHDAPAAFDVFASLYWSFSPKGSLPDRGILWLVLKLMATAPPRYREPVREEGFLPTSDLQSFQKIHIKSRNNPQAHLRYPVALPQGVKLEQELRQAISQKLREKDSPQSIDWVRLALHLDENLND